MSPHGKGLLVGISLLLTIVSCKSSSSHNGKRFLANSNTYCPCRCTFQRLLEKDAEEALVVLAAVLAAASARPALDGLLLIPAAVEDHDTVGEAVTTQVPPTTTKIVILGMVEGVRIINTRQQRRLLGPCLQ